MSCLQSMQEAPRLEIRMFKIIGMKMVIDILHVGNIAVVIE